MNKFKYDVAISLCKQDVNFARSLVEAINPSLKVFFYEDRQEELMSKSGPEAFAKVFKQEARIVLLISRKEWGESYYTEIERNAILDRTIKGYNFLLVVPIEPNEIPSWYPSTRIYLNPTKFTIEQLARFIEFKITEEGGIIKPITLEDKNDHFDKKWKEKIALIKLQKSSPAIISAKEEVQLFKNIFNQKIELLRASNFFGTIGFSLFSEYNNGADCSFKGFTLECNIDVFNYNGVSLESTQEYAICFRLYQETNRSSSISIIAEVEYKFYYSDLLKGWAKPIPCGRIPLQSPIFQLLFRNINNQISYDLKQPKKSFELIDYWFQNLFKLGVKDLEKYL